METFHMRKRALYLAFAVGAGLLMPGCAEFCSNIRQWYEEQNEPEKDLNKIIQEARAKKDAKAAKKDASVTREAEAGQSYASGAGDPAPQSQEPADPAAQAPASGPGISGLEAAAADTPLQKAPEKEAVQGGAGYDDGRIPLSASVPEQIEPEPAEPDPAGREEGPGPKGYPLGGFYSGKVGFEYEITLPEKDGYMLVKSFSVLTEDTDRYIFDLYSGKSIDMRISMENTLDSSGSRLNSDVMLILEQGNVFRMTIDSQGSCKADDLLYEDEVGMLVEGLLEEYDALRSDHEMMRHLHGYGRESVVPMLEMVFE